jgi:hypothetical protein
MVLRAPLASDFVCRTGATLQGRCVHMLVHMAHLYMQRVHVQLQSKRTCAFPARYMYADGNTCTRATRVYVYSTCMELSRALNKYASNCLSHTAWSINKMLPSMLFTVCAW